MRACWLWVNFVAYFGHYRCNCFWWFLEKTVMETTSNIAISLYKTWSLSVLNRNHCFINILPFLLFITFLLHPLIYVPGNCCRDDVGIACNCMQFLLHKTINLANIFVISKVYYLHKVWQSCIMELSMTLTPETMDLGHAFRVIYWHENYTFTHVFNAYCTVKHTDIVYMYVVWLHCYSPV